MNERIKTMETTGHPHGHIGPRFQAPPRESVATANPVTIHPDVHSLTAVIADFKTRLTAAPFRPSGLCGFDGFIDTFVRVQTPASMAEFGPKVAAAAGIAASFPVRHLGDKFGGNGPLFAAAMHDIFSGAIDLTCIGAMGREAVLPIYQAALGGKTKRLHTLADPAHSTCLEFTDGKIMLSDLAACAEVTWERLIECVGQAVLDTELKAAQFISAVNWGKLLHAGAIEQSRHPSGRVGRARQGRLLLHGPGRI